MGGSALNYSGPAGTSLAAVFAPYFSRPTASTWQSRTADTRQVWSYDVLRGVLSPVAGDGQGDLQHLRYICARWETDCFPRGCLWLSGKPGPEGSRRERGRRTPHHWCAQPNASFLVTRRDYARLTVDVKGDNAGKDAFQFDIWVLSIC